MKNYLNFEKEVEKLENEIEKLKDPYNQMAYLRLIKKFRLHKAK